MSYFAQTKIIDDLGNMAEISDSNELRVAEPIRVAGQVMGGSQVDTNFWTVTPTGSGTATQTGGVQTLSTGITANSAVSVRSGMVARFIGQSEHRYAAIVAMGDTGTVNNVRRWGAFNGTDGCYFKLSGTTLSIATMSGGVETAVASTSWNGNQTVPTLTNPNTYRIEYRLKGIYFIINGVVCHTLTVGTTPWAATANLPIWHDNTNSGGSTTNVTMGVWVATIYRIGMLETQPKYAHITAAGTTTGKYSAGTLHRVVINTFQSSGSATLTIYDNTAGSGTVIGVISGPAQAQPVCLEYRIPFNIGLTVVAVGTWDVTVVYQ